MEVKEQVKYLLSSMRRKILLIILLILLTVEIIFFIFIEDEQINTIDIETTKYLQETLLNINPNNKIPFELKFIHYLNDKYSPYLLISIIYNYFTVYDCFILVNILSINYSFSFIFKMAYRLPSYNYYDNGNSDSDDLITFYCGYGWGFPSEESIIAVSFYLAIYKIITKLNCRFDKKEKILKLILLILFIVLLFAYSLGFLLTGYYYISHIVFSVLFGLIAYLIFFESNFFNLLNGKELTNFITKHFWLYIICNLSLFVGFSIAYLMVRKYADNKQYEVCMSYDGTKQFNKSGNYYSYMDGTYCFSVLFLGNIFAIIGIKFDLKYLHKNSEDSYLQNNFPREIEELISNKSTGSFSGSIHIVQETVWNKTSFSISLLRLLIVIVFWWACFFAYFFVPLHDEHIGLILFIKMLLPPSVFYLGIFFFLKPFLKLIGLTNSTLNEILRDI